MQEYQSPRPESALTFALDEKAQNAVLGEEIKRPKGYTVSYHGNPEVEKMHFGPKHPMKPWRLTLTNKIVMAYGMHEAMDMYIARAATNQELTQFHKQEYIDFLQRYSISPQSFYPPDSHESPESPPLIALPRTWPTMAATLITWVTTARSSMASTAIAPSTPAPLSTPLAS